MLRNDSNADKNVMPGPAAIVDVDHDSTPDVVATLLDPESGEEKQQRLGQTQNTRGQGEQNKVRRRVVAISGKSGRRLWTYGGDQLYDAQPTLAWSRLATFAPGRAQNLIAVMDETKWLGIDAAGGRLRIGPIDLGFLPVRPVQHADLDGDGEPEILALGPGGGRTTETLHAFAIRTGRQLWFQTVSSAYQGPGSGVPPWFKGAWNPATSPDLPLIVDLDHDGRAEILAPDSGPMPGLTRGYRGVLLIDGIKGTIRWRRGCSRWTSRRMAWSTSWRCRTWTATVFSM